MRATLALVAGLAAITILLARSAEAQEFTIQVEDPKPLAQAAFELESESGVAITFEEAPVVLVPTGLSRS